MDAGQKSKFRYITEGRQRTAAERAEALDRYRESFAREAGIEGTGTPSQRAVIEIAAVSALEVDVLATRFVRCFAKPDEMERLNNAKNQLARALRLLGLPRLTTAAGHGPGPTALEVYLASREQAGNAKAAGLDDGSAEEVR